MAIKQSSGYCHHCQQPRPFAKNAPNHVLHFVVTLFTFGLWSPVWIVLSVKAAGSSAICTACGMAKGSGAPSGATTREVGAAQQSPADWYPDADDPSQERYWDGTQWTAQRRPAPDAANDSSKEIASRGSAEAVKSPDPQVEHDEGNAERAGERPHPRGDAADRATSGG